MSNSIIFCCRSIVAFQIVHGNVNINSSQAIKISMTILQWIFACWDWGSGHVSARISGLVGSFWKIPSLVGWRDQCLSGKPIFWHSGPLGWFLRANFGAKVHFFHVSGPVDGPPGVRASVRIWFFWPEMWPIMWGVTTSFKLEDWWTLEGARAALVETV